MQNMRRVPCSFLPLYIHIHCHAGFEFHRKFILVDGQFFNQLADEGLHHNL